MNEKLKIKLSLVINIIVCFLVLLSIIIMFTGYKFMHGHEIVLQATKFGLLRYFTAQSNIFVAVVSAFFAIKDVQLLKGKIKYINKKYYIWKLISTSSVGLTFIVVFGYLGPIAKFGLVSLLMNANLFLHLIVPLLSIICFIFFEKTNEIKYTEVFYGIIPTVLYATYYLFNILIHIENGNVPLKYDLYRFVQNGISVVFFVFPIMLLLSYLINLSLWYLNRKGFD